MKLDGIMFDHFIFSLFSFKVRCVRSKVYVHTRKYYDVVMNIVAKGGVFEFIGLRRTKNGIVLFESYQDWFEFFAI